MSGHDESKSAVKTARKPHNRCLAIDVAQTCSKSRCLHREDFLTAIAKLILVLGDKRIEGKSACKVEIFCFERKGIFQRSFFVCCSKTLVSTSFCGNSEQVDFGVGYACCKLLAFGKNLSVFGNKVVTAENKVTG